MTVSVPQQTISPPAKQPVALVRGLGLGLLGALALSPGPAVAAPPPLGPSAPARTATPANGPSPKPEIPAAAPPTAVGNRYQPVDCPAERLDPRDCSEKQVSDLLGLYDRSGLNDAERLQSDRDQITCLERYYQRTRCAYATCFLAEGLNSLSKRQAEGEQQRSRWADTARAYGTACLSCTRKTAANELPLGAVEKFQPPAEKLPVRAQRAWGGILLGVGVASLAAGFTMLPFNGQISDGADCMSAGQPVRCITQLDSPIAATLVVGGLATVGGAILLGLGCTACKRWQLPQAALSSATVGGSP